MTSYFQLWDKGNCSMKRTMLNIGKNQQIFKYDLLIIVKPFYTVT